MLTALALGYWLSVAVLVACSVVVMGILGHVSACRTAVGTHVWWTISRAKTEAIATQYRRLVQLREMGGPEAYRAYKAEVGCLWLSEPWAPNPIDVLDEYWAIDREHFKRDWEREFGEPFEDAR